MKKTSGALIAVVSFFAFTSMAVAIEPAQTMQLARDKNPCAAKEMMKNPCSMKNPCDMKEMMKNPCGMKAMPAAGAIPIREMAIKDPGKLAMKGNALWADATLGTSGNSCSTCHPDGAGLKSTPWPRYIAMADDTLTVDQMINFCMLNPMKAKPLDWNSQKMTALAAYVAANSGKGGEAVNPCSMKKMKNPCAAKEMMKNPCGMK